MDKLQKNYHPCTHKKKRKKREQKYETLSSFSRKKKYPSHPSLVYSFYEKQFSIRTSRHKNGKITDEVFREITAIQSCPISHE